MENNKSWTPIVRYISVKRGAILSTLFEARRIDVSNKVQVSNRGLCQHEERGGGFALTFSFHEDAE